VFTIPSSSPTLTMAEARTVTLTGAERPFASTSAVWSVISMSTLMACAGDDARLGDDGDDQRLARAAEDPEASTAAREQDLARVDALQERRDDGRRQDHDEDDDGSSD
jgi:hypothetical protein